MAEIKTGIMVEIIAAGETNHKHQHWVGHTGEVLQPARVTDWLDGLARWEVAGVINDSGIPIAIRERFLKPIDLPSWEETQEALDWEPNKEKMTHDARQD